MASMKAEYFESPAAFRKWLAQNHARRSEVLVGFYKKGSGKRGLTYDQSVEEALCFGWIDGVRKSVDENRYTMRFSPRKPKSKWSLINVRRVENLIAQKKMTKAGIDAYEARVNQKGIDYSYEVQRQALAPEYQKRFEAAKRAWKYFNEQPPWYRRVTIFRVMSAKKEETRVRRLEQLIACSAKGEWIPGFPSKGK